jgi:hypothetical protein
LRYVLAAVIFDIAGAAPGHAADGCANIEIFDYSSKFDNAFRNADKFQHPSVGTCIDYNDDPSSYNKRIHGVLFQRNSGLVFDLDGGGEARAELRFKPLPNIDGGSYTLSATANITETPAGRFFTIGQLFAVNSNGIRRPLLRIANVDGGLSAVAKENFANSENSSVFSPYDGGSTLFQGDEVSYSITQTRIRNSRIHLTVVLKGEAAFDRDIDGAYTDGGGNHFKLGCYMNNGSGCTAEFSAISVTPEI